MFQVCAILKFVLDVHVDEPPVRLAELGDHLFTSSLLFSTKAYLYLTGLSRPTSILQ